MQRTERIEELALNCQFSYISSVDYRYYEHSTENIECQWRNATRADISLMRINAYNVGHVETICLWFSQSGIDYRPGQDRW